MPMKQRHREMLQTITGAVLEVVTTLASGGIFVLDDPNAAVFRRTVRGQIHFSLPDCRISRALKRAERRGLVNVARPQFAPIRVRVTEKGYRLLAKRKLKGAAADHPKRWDGKWRLIIFDVPEHRHRDRDLLRRTIRGLGFYRLQASVWIYPYECHEIVELIRQVHAFDRSVVSYIVADYIEGDDYLRRHFDV